MKKKTKSWKLLLGLALLILWLLIFPKRIPHTNSNSPHICYNSNCYSLEIANTPDLREKWLMNRNVLAEYSWMIFIFDKEDIYRFWMKNTLIPLDMVRLSSWLDVIYIANAIPCKQEICPIYSPDKKAKYVLEISWLQTSKIWLKIWAKMIKKGNR